MVRELVLAICTAALLLPAASQAAEDVAGANMASMLRGRWTGNIQGTFRSQDVSWRFVETANGSLQGFMGPLDAGMPSLPMEDLQVQGSSIRFSIPGQHASFAGTLHEDGISGFWSQGTRYPLQMRRRVFAFDLGTAVHAVLEGQWQAVSVTPPLLLDFTLMDDGRIAGELDIPQRGIVDVPLVNLYVDSTGLASFATDNGRSFTGKLVNGVLVGEYRSAGNWSQDITLVHAGRQDVAYVLPMPAAVADTLLGVWERRDQGGIYFEFERNAANEVQGWLSVPRDGFREPILQMQVQGGNFSLLSFSGRSYQGSIDAGEMTGEYRIGRARYNFSFVRNAAPRSGQP